MRHRGIGFAISQMELVLTKNDLNILNNKNHL